MCNTTYVHEEPEGVEKPEHEHGYRCNVFVHIGAYVVGVEGNSSRPGCVMVNT